MQDSFRPSAPTGADFAAREPAPVAIIDIGSNSVRLVVYQDHGRAPVPLYNEKLLCGLGRGVATTGRLPEDAVERALKALARFRVLCGTMQASEVKVIATAAAREAENGPAFLAAAAEACGQNVELLTGEREAALSAQGVISGLHEPDGIVGDLGGGSLELVEVAGGRAGQGLTLPLGGLALQDLSGASPEKAQKIAREKLHAAGLLEALRGRSFYAVGGTWRALARLQMIERGYPLHVMHGYEFKHEERGLTGLVDRAGAASKTLNAVTEARRPLLAYGAIVLDEIVRIGRPASISVSAHGVREGLLHDSLDQETRKLDPLLEAAAELNHLRARSPGHAEELRAWTDAFMASSGIDESHDERRLRHAACLLSDTGWRAHPDYRGSHSVTLITHATFLGIDHPGRAYVALAVFFRHSGLSLDKVDDGVAGIAGPRLLSLARLFGALLRVAFPMSAAMAGLIGRTPLVVEGGRLVLTLPPDLAPLANERLMKRLRALAKIIDREAAIKIGEA